MTSNAEIPRLKIPAKYGTVWNSQKPYQIWYGGRGSAKSWTKAIQLLLKSQSSHYFRGVFARDTQKNVRASQFQLFKDLEKRFSCFRNQFTFSEGPMRITCRATGNYLMGGSFEMPDTLRSVPDPTDFWAEEPITREAQINRDDFLDIVGTLRNPENVQTQFHFTFNPISMQTWIYEDFFLKDLYDCEKLFINYPENPYCPKTTIDFLESLKIIDPKRYEVDALGNWGIAHEGLIYKLWEPVDEMPEPQYYGVDFGYTHPATLVQAAVRDEMNGDPKQDLYWQELMYETGHTEQSLIRKFDELKVRKDIPMICDNESPSSIKALQEAGYRATACKKYAGSVWDGINHVLGHNLKIVRGSDNLIAEVTNYCWGVLPDGKTLREEPASNSVDHACDGGRYAAEGTKTDSSGADYFHTW
jgi:phage terminase large subunit